MKTKLMIALGMLLVGALVAEAQPQKGRRKGDRQKGSSSRRSGGQSIGDSNPLAIGDSGVAWYTTWKTGLAEAKRTNKPIFFMSAATTCSNVPGVL